MSDLTELRRLAERGDLLDQLRKAAEERQRASHRDVDSVLKEETLEWQAADTIDALQAENKRLREALDRATPIYDVGGKAP